MDADRVTTIDVGKSQRVVLLHARHQYHKR